MLSLFVMPFGMRWHGACSGVAFTACVIPNEITPKINFIFISSSYYSLFFGAKRAKRWRARFAVNWGAMKQRNNVMQKWAHSAEAAKRTSSTFTVSVSGSQRCCHDIYFWSVWMCGVGVIGSLICPLPLTTLSRWKLCLMNNTRKINRICIIAKSKRAFGFGVINSFICEKLAFVAFSFEFICETLETCSRARLATLHHREHRTQIIILFYMDPISVCLDLLLRCANSKGARGCAHKKNPP